MDYQKLLKAYMQLVYQQEGSFFLRPMGIDQHPLFTQLTSEERNELARIAGELKTEGV